MYWRSNADDGDQCLALSKGSFEADQTLPGRSLQIGSDLYITHHTSSSIDDELVLRHVDG